METDRREYQALYYQVKYRAQMQMSNYAAVDALVAVLGCFPLFPHHARRPPLADCHGDVMNGYLQTLLHLLVAGGVAISCVTLNIGFL